ncbi:MAG: WD40/YVTN/BNR-like repeat-containing protein [Saprospiraceae bacterium]
MKNVIFLLLLFTLFISGCGNPNTILLSEADIETEVNPEIGYLLKNNQFYAYLEDANTIRGLGDRKPFYTEDDFQSFYQKEQAVPLLVNYQFPSFRSGGNIASFSNSIYGNTLHVTKDGGISWVDVSLNDINNRDQFHQAFFKNNRGWVITYYSFSDGIYTKIYSVVADQLFFLSAIENYAPVDIIFLNEQVGYILLKKEHVENTQLIFEGNFLSKTTDGGRTWSTPTLVTKETSLLNLTAFNEQHLVAYTLQGSSVPILDDFFSHDGGKTWTPRKAKIAEDPNPEIVALSIVNEKLGFYLDAAPNLYKTVDSGITWTKVSERTTPFGNNYLQFYDENNGIAGWMGGGYGPWLFRTKNGGKTWDLIIYPYPYTIR